MRVLQIGITGKVYSVKLSLSHSALSSQSIPKNNNNN